ncbi:MAG: hypothetical protein GEU98_16390 [Pseudonocardiaceae bacterium]|nr:hypothetical protein [Pseudonocardiaceae bacterium]
MVAACWVLFVGVGCATVPEESLPQPVTGGEPGQGSSDVDPPQQNASPRDVVRGFVDSSGATVNNHAAARVYLDSGSQSTWKSDDGPVIIEDTFSTVPAPEAAQPKDPNERIIMLRGRNVGRLAADGSFSPSIGPYEQPMKLRRQRNGQWRIVRPPDGTVTTFSKFNANYFGVRLYFFDPDINVLVPDLRYVSASRRADLPRRVIDLLLDGPSDMLSGAVTSMLDDNAATSTNVTDTADGALAVPLTGLGELNEPTKKLLAAQVVLSLQTVTTSRIRLLSDGAPLIEGQPDWRTGDVPSLSSAAAPAPNLPGLMTDDGQVLSMSTGSPVPGPAGTGAYQVESAAQSIDGGRLAVVQRSGSGPRLRIGELGDSLQQVDLPARSMTRPTWRPALSSGEKSTEVWTVVNGRQVVRVGEQANGTWASSLVNATDLNAFGPITELRLSRDGTRVAVVAGGKLVVAGVVRDDQGGVTLRAPRQLQPDKLKQVVGVDWLRQDTLVAATSLSSLPVVKLPVDGLRLDAFDASNLTLPVEGVTAAPGRHVVAVDHGGMSMASDVGEVWRPHPQTRGADARPFFPG